jgi:3-hydroxybutyryl-CoA dehydratase
VKVGDRAEVSRTFGPGDLHDYAGLSGHKPSGERVPEPLIGALFSYLLGVKLPGMGAMYLKQETHYLQDGLIGETINAQVEVTRLRPDKELADLSTTCQGANGRLIASGRALVYIGDVESNH